MTHRDGYLPIGDHALIGDMHSAALVGADRTIDWYCPGRFDAPSVFAALLDRRRGGSWSLAPRAEVEDFMPVSGIDGRRGIVRRVHSTRPGGRLS